MMTKINKEVNKEIWWVLREINKVYQLTPKNQYVRFDISQSSENQDMPSPDIQRRSVYKLESLGVFEIYKKIYITPHPLIEGSSFEMLANIYDIKPKGFLLKISQQKFKKIYKSFEKKFSELNKKGRVEFIDDEAILKLGDKKCQLPSYKNGHFFCRVAFEYPIGEPVDWSEIAEKMDTDIKHRLAQAQSSKETEKIKRFIYDTVRAINKRVREVLGIEELFRWEGKTIKRVR